MATETRFSMLARTDPERAKHLAALAQCDAEERWRYYSQLAGLERTVPHEDAYDLTTGPGEADARSHHQVSGLDLSGPVTLASTPVSVAALLTRRGRADRRRCGTPGVPHLSGDGGCQGTRTQRLAQPTTSEPPVTGWEKSTDRCSKNVRIWSDQNLRLVSVPGGMAS
jgi:pyruvate-ferredoxin/flavodoxin oxidoreductase